MIWVAALSMGVACYLGAGILVGRPAMLRVAIPWRSSRLSTTRRRAWLQQAAVSISPRQFWLGSILLGVFTFLAVFVLTDAPVVAIVPAVGAGAIPAASLGRRRAARLRRVQEAWPDGLRDLRASISAGRSLPQALHTLAETGPGTVREALHRFPSLARMLGTATALEVVKEELADPTSDRVIEVLILALERGGEIVQEILDDLIVATTRDVKVLEEIETDGLEMRINARAVLVLPWLVLVALTLRAGPFRDFYQSSGGLVVILCGAVLTVIGYGLVTRLARTHTEPRVFDSASIGGDRS